MREMKRNVSVVCVCSAPNCCDTGHRSANQPACFLPDAHPGILDYTWFSDEAWFHLSGYISSQNSRIWASENPNAIHEEPPHSEKIGVLCGMASECHTKTELSGLFYTWKNGPTGCVETSVTSKQRRVHILKSEDSESFTLRNQ